MRACRGFVGWRDARLPALLHTSGSELHLSLPKLRGQLRPLRDPGLLPTVVESYAFWRVSKGGPALPAPSTPWDSAMPIWDLDLSEEDRWKVLLGEYFIAGVGPREPEKHE